MYIYIYLVYISDMYCQLGDSILPTTLYNLKSTPSARASPSQPFDVWPAVVAWNGSAAWSMRNHDDMAKRRCGEVLPKNLGNWGSTPFLVDKLHRSFSGKRSIKSGFWARFSSKRMSIFLTSILFIPKEASSQHVWLDYLPNWFFTFTLLFFCIQASNKHVWLDSLPK